MTKSLKFMRPCWKYLVNPFSLWIQIALGKQKNSFFRAVFLDRDGNLNLEKGYITDPSDIELYPDSGNVLRSLKQLGFLAVVITNQSAIGRGLMSEAQFEQVNAAFREQLQQSGTGYDALYYCPHRPEDDCPCRKPKPGLIFQAARDLGIDLSRSYMIGDKLSDIEAGKRAGCKTILVLTGKGIETAEMIKRENAIIQPDTIQACLSDALVWIEKTHPLN
jgi:D-glycero-D-manno-heptose 1,7-bisphosphate phosphatase